MTIFEQAWDKLQDIVAYWNTLSKEEKFHNKVVTEKVDALMGYLLDNCPVDEKRTTEFAAEILALSNKRELSREDLENSSHGILPLVFFRLLASDSPGYNITFRTQDAPNVARCWQKYGEIIKVMEKLMVT